MKRSLLVVFLLAIGLPAIAQTCTTFPCVVATVSLTNQSQAIPVTAIYTPANNGVFKINVYVTEQKNGQYSYASWEAKLGWTDDYGKQELNVGASPLSPNVFSLAVEDIAGQPLTYSTKALFGAKTITYSLYIVIEQLQ